MTGVITARTAAIPILLVALLASAAGQATPAAASTPTCVGAKILHCVSLGTPDVERQSVRTGGRKPKAVKARVRKSTARLSPQSVVRMDGNPKSKLRVVLRKGAPPPDPGKPFVIPATEEFGGVLGIVTSTRRMRGGRLEVLTRPATLDQAYAQLRIELRGSTLDELDARASAAASRAFKCQGSGPEPHVDISADFSKLKPQFELNVARPEIYFMLSGTVRLAVDLSIDSKVSCSLASGAGLSFPIGGTPVVVTVKPALTASTSGAIRSGFDWTPHIAVGVHRGPAVDQSFHTFNPGSATVRPFGGEAQARLFLGASVGVSVAERVGVEGKAGPQVTARVGTEGSSLCAGADASLHADLEAYADVFVKRWSFAIAKGDFGSRRLFNVCRNGGGNGPQGSANPPGIGAPRFSAVTAGQVHSCGLTVEHEILCWGGYQAWPDPPAGTFTEVSAGNFHTCGLRTGGEVVCWGSNNQGQTASPGGAFQHVAGGFWHTCGIRPGGAAQCWGNNDYGQSSPPGGTFRQLAPGADQTCGLQSDNAAFCWGGDDLPDPPPGEFSELSLDDTACGLRFSGDVLCWGFTLLGYEQPPDGPFEQVGVKAGVACGLRASGATVCWGESTTGALSPPDDTFSRLAVGAGHVCGLKTSGSIVCWGANHYGQASPPN